MMPGRTQSPCVVGCASTAAEFASERGPSSPAVPRANAASASSTPSARSAFAKCVVSVIVPTAGSARSRRCASPKRSGTKPSRFMPLFIFRYTASGRSTRAAASIAICSSSWTPIVTSRRAAAARSFASKQPSSSRIGFVQPSSRSSVAVSVSRIAMPSASATAGPPSATVRTSPWPYASAFSTAHTFAPGARRLATPMLCAIARRDSSAWMGRDTGWTRVRGARRPAVATAS